jgi:hypothetical protein
MSAVFGIDASRIRSDDSPETKGALDIQFDASDLETLGCVAVIEERLRADVGHG